MALLQVADIPRGANAATAKGLYTQGTRQKPRNCTTTHSPAAWGACQGKTGVRGRDTSLWSPTHKTLKAHHPDHQDKHTGQPSEAMPGKCSLLDAKLPAEPCS